ncbi:MAG: tellurium resistance protein TerC [Bacteroidetes bacterium]|nr:tellurium resistance protein TerC [Bacteroidota bacterium]
MVPDETLALVLFNVFVIAMLLLDLGIFQRRAHEIGIQEALGWSLFWIVLSLLFNVGLYFWQGKEVALQFLTGYLIEKSLSVDNLFVFLMLFMYFKVPPKYQHKVLFWGILGALAMRGALIAVGVALISRFFWILYVFGVFLVFTGIKMGFQKETVEIHPERNVAVRMLKKLVPVTPGYHGSKFFLKIDGKYTATLLFVVLIVVETTDLLFALDSIPAIFAITTDPFIVYTSNVFAILGLRALYFALAGLMNLFHYLKIGLAIVLTFVGVKMLLAHVFPIPITIALAVIGGVILLSVVASLIWPKKEIDRLSP